jgi:flagellar operon protein (TIGR03826 family)
MNLKNCPKCGKLFAKKANYKLCPVCRDSEENDFEKVKDYLWDNPKASIEEVHNETGVDRDLIIKFVRDGRLIAEGIEVNFDLECKRCGDPIAKGKYCASCQRDLLKGFDPKAPDEKEKEKLEKSPNKMFTKDRIEKRNKNK